MKTKTVIALACILILLAFVVSALDFTPKGNVNLEKRYNILNATNYTLVSGGNFCLTSDCLHRVYYNGTDTIIE